MTNRWQEQKKMCSLFPARSFLHNKAVHRSTASTTAQRGAYMTHLDRGHGRAIRGEGHVRNPGGHGRVRVRAAHQVAGTHLRVELEGDGGKTD